MFIWLELKENWPGEQRELITGGSAKKERIAVSVWWGYVQSTIYMFGY